MASYVSADFEYDVMPDGRLRVIVRNRDDGNVPPPPSSTRFPTDPDDFRPFIVGTYTSAAVGESFTRVATLADISGIDEKPMVYFRDLNAQFMTDGVIVGDVLRVVVVPEQYWQSDEYPGTSPFEFSVIAINSETSLTVSRPFPSYFNGLNYSIERLAPVSTVTQGITGQTTREENPVGPFTFRDSRFNHFVKNAVEAQNYTDTIQVGMRALVDEQNSSGLVDFSYTAGTDI